MGRRDARHRRLALWLPVGLVLAVLAAAGTAYLVDPEAPRDPSPAAVPPPPGLELPAVTTPAPVAGPVAGTPDPAKVRRALAGPLRDADLGRHVLATVSALDGTLLYSTGTGEAAPASTMKLLTTTAALETLGPDHTFTTTVVAAGPRRVVLVGGGDPLLSVPDLTRLARATAAAVDGPVRVGYDAHLFSGPAVNPHWEPGYVPEEVSPISALWVGEGDGEADPPAAAAAQFTTALGRAGVRVLGEPAPAHAPADGPELASVDSEPLAGIVEHTLLTSDNNAAEVLARHVGLATSGTGSFRAGVAGVLDTLDALGVPTSRAVVHDGSGLSRGDRLDPDTLTAVLETAGSDAHPELRSVLTGLPVAGFTGSLEYRFDAEDAGRGLVRAKTGTLSGVSALAGTVVDRDGVPMVFALLADRIAVVDTLDARAALDDATSALAACRCGGAGTVAP
ncbi:D-alanyl-D-alanine carboxypeptidase/D-alanyl-D-alanine endopeptidase [Nocardioides aquiterrae]|uniref:Serine-type D-Ala-D-Ala carboxypeptidase n=1 Tax=Nocardioides aquiterrae TaxID=203799 RepID=A0ABP4EXU4_9ACTN